MSVPHFAKLTKDIGPADPSANIKVQLVGNVRNQDWLTKKLMEVSDPTNPNYGKHLTKEELDAQTNPDKADIDKICSCLDSHGIKYERHAGSVQANATVKQLEDLFHTKLHKFTLPENDASTKDFVVRRTGKYSLLSDLWLLSSARFPHSRVLPPLCLPSLFPS
eukprot:Phypoly_transcript_20911.p1 GENE.Phypoly_transcript_20911~~Phypoly_transcript_20911.p1  ORF type:complete len:164 (+),score=21.37 Phypoly_transcript_20911:59-550(+)